MARSLLVNMVYSLSALICILVMLICSVYNFCWLQAQIKAFSCIFCAVSLRHAWVHVQWQVYKHINLPGRDWGELQWQSSRSRTGDRGPLRDSDRLLLLEVWVVQFLQKSLTQSTFFLKVDWVRDFRILWISKYRNFNIKLCKML